MVRLNSTASIGWRRTLRDFSAISDTFRHHLRKPALPGRSKANTGAASMGERTGLFSRRRAAVRGARSVSPP